MQPFQQYMSDRSCLPLGRILKPLETEHKRLKGFFLYLRLVSEFGQPLEGDALSRPGQKRYAFRRRGTGGKGSHGGSMADARAWRASLRATPIAGGGSSNPGAARSRETLPVRKRAGQTVPGTAPVPKAPQENLARNAKNPQ